MAASAASSTLAFSGERGHSMPMAANTSCTAGTCAPGPKLLLSTVMLPGSLSTLSSSHDSSADAMKLNMMVVITTWLPRQACSAAGTAAQAMPNAAAANTISGSTIHAGQLSASHSATSAVPMPPSIACPSPPMLNSPPWKATATASPVKTKVVA